MNRYITHYKANTGFSLLEALISLVILSFGLLAIATFQGHLVLGSGYNKTRSEAMALAQQKLDDIRGYTTEEELVAKLKEQVTSGVITPTIGEEFPEHAFADLVDAASPSDVTTVVACADGFEEVPDANNPIQGTTQDFTRKWKYCLDDNELLYTVVEVSWTDMQGDTDMVALHSMVSWKNPAAAVLLAEIPAEPEVASATGRAYLGDGSVTQAQIDEAKAKNDGSFLDNQDGTFSLFKANDGADVALVDADTNEIVLTLEDACKTQDPKDCFEFVKIKGRVYLDNNSSNQSLNTIYILASDAAYCARVFDTGGVPFNAPDIDDDSNNDYEYYDYTCYLGGGWYGNIGLLLTATNAGENDRVCVGDPNAATTDGWKFMELAKRRVYRGLVYKRNPADYDEWITDGGFGPVDDEGLTAAEALLNIPLFFSKGIADGTEYPDFEKDVNRAYVLDVNGNKIPQYPGRDGGHDYLVINSGGQADASNCVAPATQADSRAWDDLDGDGVMDDAVEVFTDSNANGVYDSGETYVDANGDGNYDAVVEVGDLGSLFANTPGDFICFNDEYYDGDGSAFDTTGTKPYLDGEEDPKFRNYPYLDSFNGDDKSSVDSNGTVIPADTLATVYGAEAACRWDPSRPPPSVHMLSGSVINKTSSGANDLQGSTVVSSGGVDDCWFVDGAGVKVTNPSGTTLDYVCRVYEWGDQTRSGDGWDGYITLTPPSSASVQCENLAAYPTASLVHQYNDALFGNSVEGDLATANEDFICLNLAEMTITGSMTAYHNDIGSDQGTTVAAIRTNADNSVTSFPCTVNEVAGIKATFTCIVHEETVGGGWKGKVVATPPSGFTCDTTEKVFDPAITADAVAFDTKCAGTDTTLTVTGTLSSADNTTSGVTYPDVTATGAAVACTTMPGSGYDINYSCEVTFDYLTGEWVGTINVANPADGSMTCSGDTSWTMTATTDPDSSTASVTCTTGDFAYVTVNVTVQYPTAYQYCEANYENDLTNCPSIVNYDWTTGQIISITPLYSEWPTNATQVAVSMVGTNLDGTCTPASITGTTADGVGTVHTFNCKTNREINWNQSWNGDIQYSITNTYWASLISPATGSSPVSGVGAGQSATVTATVDKAP